MAMWRGLAPPTSRIAHEDGDEDHVRAQVGLEVDEQPAGTAAMPRAMVQAAGVELAPMGGAEGGQGHDQGQLGHLRRLELEGPDLEPGLGAPPLGARAARAPGAGRPGRRRR